MDAVTFISAPALLLAAALVACYVRGRCAARISPLAALGR
jgi:hypothetical protein